MDIMPVCLLSAVSRRVGALQISIIIKKELERRMQGHRHLADIKD